MAHPGTETDDRLVREAAADRAARSETMRRDGARGLGENLEQADVLIRAAFELAAGMPRADR